jgi:hypothetical protein
MFLRLLPLLGLFFLAQATPAQQSATPNPVAPEGCPVTQPATSTFVPPTPYPSNAGPGWFWVGTRKLWTMLPANGVWSQLPHTESGYTQKMAWLSGDNHWRLEPHPAITVVGKRRDGASSPLTVTWINNGHTDTLESVMGVRVNIPSLGCWEITGRYEDDQLTFVIWVAR